MSSGTAKQLSPGQVWLTMPAPQQIMFLEGLVQGLNQGVRHCALEVTFALATRLSGQLPPDDALAVGSLNQQMKTWAKSGLNVFKFSKPLESYATTLSVFYEHYPKYHDLSPAYLMSYMDDQHGMGPSELFSLHEHSLNGFRR
jgi:hypothetical protein